MQKSTWNLAALVSLFIMSVVNVGCGSIEQAPAAVNSEAMILAEVTNNEGFQEARGQLARYGDELDMQQATVKHLDNGFAVIIPVNGEESEYSSLVYQRLSGQVPSVTLELSGRPGSATHSPLAECDGWGSWSTTGSRCSWHILCVGEATILDRKRCRTCWNRGGTYTQCEYTSVRNKCGC